MDQGSCGYGGVALCRAAEQVKLYSFKSRLLRADMILFSKVFNEKTAIEIDALFALS